MARLWKFRPHDEVRIQELVRSLRVSPLLARVLISRGLTEREDVIAFLDAKLTSLHDPGLLPGINEAADRLVDAVRSHRRVTIYGDYDVDGVTATSLLWHCLKLAGGTVDYYIPSRLEEGYGLNCDAIRQLHADDPLRLLLSVDCGIASVTEAALARELGLELMISDHHHFDDELPDSDVLVHPRLPGTCYPFGDLCGVGVAFKLAWAVCQRLGDGRKATPRMREFLMSAVGLAAIGTVADVVPLRDENRVLVLFGLQSLADRASTGLRALMKVAGIHDKPVLDAEDIAFAIGPRINAAGRLGQARLAVELLTTGDAERAASLAEYLDQLNRNRQTVERRIFKRAREMVSENPDWQEQSALVLADPDWHPGVIGIVAGRVAEHFEKPAVLLGRRKGDLSSGSGRTFADFDLYAGLRACSGILEGFGGHRAAAGVRVACNRIDEFRKVFVQYVADNHSPEDHHRELPIDAQVRLADVTHAAVRDLQRLGPFGQDNRRPRFAAMDVELAGRPRRIGEGERHLSLRLRQYGTTLRAVAFGRGEWADEIDGAGGTISICFAPVINSFRGRVNVELHLIDWQPGSRLSKSAAANAQALP